MGIAERCRPLHAVAVRRVFQRNDARDIGCTSMCVSAAGLVCSQIIQGRGIAAQQSSIVRRGSRGRCGGTYQRKESQRQPGD